MGSMAPLGSPQCRHLDMVRWTESVIGGHILHQQAQENGPGNGGHPMVQFQRDVLLLVQTLYVGNLLPQEILNGASGTALPGKLSPACSLEYLNKM